VPALIVQLPGPPEGGRPRRLELDQGQEASFGRGTDGQPVDVALPDLGVSRVAGRLRPVEDYWVISNLSRDKTYVVENPEGGGEFVKVAPRRLEMPVPFEFGRVVLPARHGTVSFTVFASQHAYADVDGLDRPNPDQTLTTFPLDETAKYFLVLVALCEPRLRDRSPVAIPTVPEIVARLRPLDGCQDLTRAAVNFHIDYLARSKLRVKEPDGTGQAARADWQRAALVSVALRFDVVREEHLALLPSRNAGAGGAGHSAGGHG
jgi:hypothetical protein